MPTGRQYLLGIDLGTSACKATALGLDGTALATAESRYPMSVPHPGWAEQAPEQWWQALRAAIRQLADRLSGGAQPVGIGLTGQMHTLVPLDAAWKVIRPSILWCDQRSERQAARVRDTVGAPALMRITCNPSRTAFTASKILWLQDNEPAAADRLRHVLLPKDWIVLQLTARNVTEPSDASGTGLFDLSRGSWSPEILTALDLAPDLLPQVLPSTAVAGGLLEEPAQQLNLPAGIPVICGASDQAAAAYDAGAVTAGVTACNLGTSVALTESVAAPVPGSLAHVVPGQWLYLASAHSGMVALDWWSRVTGHGHAGEVVRQAAASEAGAHGAVFIPLLIGSRELGGGGPHSGSFLGLRADHTAADLARAVLEGVAFEVRRVADALPPAPGGGRRWRVFGGGSRSPLLVQILADVLGADLEMVPGASSARGAARLLAAALNMALPEPAANGRRLTPSPLASDYQTAYAAYLTAVSDHPAERPAARQLPAYPAHDG